MPASNENVILAMTPKKGKAGVVKKWGPDFEIVVEDVDVPEPGEYAQDTQHMRPRHSDSSRVGQSFCINSLTEQTMSRYGRGLDSPQRYRSLLFRPALHAQ